MSGPAKALCKLVYLTLVALSTANLTNVFNWTTCETGETASDSVNCHCASDVFIDVIVRCHIANVTHLRTIVGAAQDVLRLNLSGNNITDIPSHSFSVYGQLIYLSLSSNKIQAISPRAFAGLLKLLELNLEDNLIKQWDTTLIEQDLPNLIMLNIAENYYWKPDQQILSLPNLKIINLLSWSASNQTHVWFWFGCLLVRSDATMRHSNTILEKLPPAYQDKVDPDPLLMRSDYFCSSSKLHFYDASYWDAINAAQFYFHCHKYVRCFKKNLRTNNLELHWGKEWFYFTDFASPECWGMMNSISYVPLIEGICSLAFNLIVIMTTLRSRVLRDSVAHVLVANIAVGDLLMSLYMIIITSTRQMMDASEYKNLYLPYYCRFVGLFFLIGQISSPFMSFVMTLERYLAVVYCMSPHVRITRRINYVSMVTIWGLSLSLAVSFMTSPQFSLKTTIVCIPFKNIDGLQLTIFLGGISIFLYAISIALYGHMYVDFKKTNQKTIQLQRENRLARRISLIVVTNVLFFILPLLITVIVEKFNADIPDFDVIVFLNTFPICFLGVNPCLNPILFSFRNETFCREFRRRCLGCLSTVVVHPS